MAFGFFLAVLSVVEGIQREYPLKEFINHAIPNLLVVATAVIVGSILLWIIEEAIQRHIAPAIQVGIQTLSAELAKEVIGFPESRRSMADTITDIAKGIETPGVQDLVEAGKIEEAVARAKPEEEINVLLPSAFSEAWEKAGDRKYEGRAREYISAARIAAPDRREPIDTDGFVRITYGRTREEILEGVAISEKARQLGGPFESYAKHVARAPCNGTGVLKITTCIYEIEGFSLPLALILLGDLKSPKISAPLKYHLLCALRQFLDTPKTVF